MIIHHIRITHTKPKAKRGLTYGGEPYSIFRNPISQARIPKKLNLINNQYLIIYTKGPDPKKLNLINNQYLIIDTEEPGQKKTTKPKSQKQHLLRVTTRGSH